MSIDLFSRFISQFHESNRWNVEFHRRNHKKMFSIAFRSHRSFIFRTKGTFFHCSKKNDKWWNKYIGYNTYDVWRLYANMDHCRFRLWFHYILFNESLFGTKGYTNMPTSTKQVLFILLRICTSCSLRIAHVVLFKFHMRFHLSQLPGINFRTNEKKKTRTNVPFAWIS